METGTAVVAYLDCPKERYWGLLVSLDSSGATLRCIDISSFNDWCRQVASNDENAIELTTVFFPIRRIEKIIKDQTTSGIPSLNHQFETIVGTSLDSFLNSKDQAA